MTAVPEAEGSGADSVHWIFKNKEHGKTSATASLGLITLWDVEGGLPQIDKYLYSQDPAVVAGALLGVGLINSGVQVRLDRDGGFERVGPEFRVEINARNSAGNRL